MIGEDARLDARSLADARDDGSRLTFRGAARQRGIVRRRGLDALLPTLAEHTRSRAAEDEVAGLIGDALGQSRLG